jgi:hypothetical protein
VHRLLQDPRRLWRRYLRNNPAFVWMVALELLGLRRTAPGFAASGGPGAGSDARSVCGPGYAGGEAGGKAVVKAGARSAPGLATES